MRLVNLVPQMMLTLLTLAQPFAAFAAGPGSDGTDSLSAFLDKVVVKNRSSNSDLYTLTEKMILAFEQGTEKQKLNLTFKNDDNGMLTSSPLGSETVMMATVFPYQIGNDFIEPVKFTSVEQHKFIISKIAQAPNGFSKYIENQGGFTETGFSNYINIPSWEVSDVVFDDQEITFKGSVYSSLGFPRGGGDRDVKVTIRRLSKAAFIYAIQPKLPGTPCFKNFQSDQDMDQSFTVADKYQSQGYCALGIMWK